VAVVRAANWSTPKRTSPCLRTWVNGPNSVGPEYPFCLVSPKRHASPPERRQPSLIGSLKLRPLAKQKTLGACCPGPCKPWRHRCRLRRPTQSAPRRVSLRPRNQIARRKDEKLEARPFELDSRVWGEGAGVCTGGSIASIARRSPFAQTRWRGSRKLRWWITLKAPLKLLRIRPHLRHA
jgi:hypothetical protein